MYRENDDEFEPEDEFEYANGGDTTVIVVAVVSGLLGIGGLWYWFKSKRESEAAAADREALDLKPFANRRDPIPGLSRRSSSSGSRRSSSSGSRRSSTSGSRRSSKPPGSQTVSGSESKRVMYSWKNRPPPLFTIPEDEEFVLGDLNR